MGNQKEPIVTPIIDIVDVYAYLDPVLRSSERELALLQHALDKETALLPKKVSIAKLPLMVAGHRVDQALEIGRTVNVFLGLSFFPAPVHYLLGYLKQFPSEISQELMSVQSIEAFPSPVACSFPWGKLKKPSFLCVRKNDRGMPYVTVSEYLQGTLMNYGQRTSGNAIKTIVFASEVSSNHLLSDRADDAEMHQQTLEMAPINGTRIGRDYEHMMIG